jgi:hypothetical protein
MEVVKMENKCKRYSSFIMSLLVADYRAKVANHAPLHKRAEAAKEARDFYKRNKELREICAKPIERGWNY